MKIFSILTTLFFLLLDPVSAFAEHSPFLEMVTTWHHLPNINYFWKVFPNRGGSVKIVFREAATGSRVYSEGNFANSRNLFIGDGDQIKIRLKSPFTPVYLYTAANWSGKRRFDTCPPAIRRTLTVRFNDGYYETNFKVKDLHDLSSDYFYVSTNSNEGIGPKIRFSILR